MLGTNDWIGPYQLIHKLGEGGFGEVWLARDSDGSSPREVAVKMPLSSEIDLDALLQEATLWARATGHPNVLEFLAARVFNGQVVLVSEYAPDGSLKNWLRRHGGSAPSIEAAMEMTRGILAGLEHLHTRSIIHRDVKPDNILLLGATPRLADFGISRVLKSTSKSAVTAGTKALIKDPDRRYQTAAEMRAALTPHLPTVKEEHAPPIELLPKRTSSTIIESHSGSRLENNRFRNCQPTNRRSRLRS